MELVYGLSGFLVFFSLVGLLVGLLKPSLFSKLLGEKSDRKHIAAAFILLFIGSSILLTIAEPEGVKQARLAEEKAETSQSEQIEQRTEPQGDVQVQEDAAPSEQNPRYYWHEVTRVVDGDTVKVRVDGKEESIRIIGIDSPESTTSKECFGNEASAKAKEFLGGKWVQLERDESQLNRDKYNRLLRYVWFDSGTDFGRRMIEEGYAHEYTYNTPYNKQAQYKETYKSAKDDDKGLWSPDTCDGKDQKPQPAAAQPAPTTPTPQPTPAPAPAPATTSGVVKKSSSSICHAPGTTYYSRTTNFTPYNTLDECLASGGRMPLR
jgi:micrococcal nuclease